MLSARDGLKKESLEGDNVSRKAYTSVVIPSILYEKIISHVEQSEGRYVSISEVVREGYGAF
jgi:hypothetical protein